MEQIVVMDASVLPFSVITASAIVMMVCLINKKRKKRQRALQYARIEKKFAIFQY